MDWLRRNWPDLLIGVALVAVIAGIIATLISGGTFFPVGGGSRTADTPTQSGPTVAGQNQGATQGGQSSGATVVPDPPGGAASTVQATTPDGANVPTVTLVDPPAGQDPADTPAAAGDQGQSSSIAVLPPDGSPPTSTLTTTVPPANQSTVTPPQTSGASSAVQSTIPAATTVTPSSSPDAPYRVSVGAYGNLDNAQRQLETFRAAGYPVFLGTQGELTIVLVGPYDTEAEARGVAQRIRQSDLGVPDPTVYLLEADDASTPAAQAAAPAGQAATTAATTPAASQQAAAQPPVTAVTGDRYLQVGAYGSRDSSLPQRQRLEGLGFVVSERLESDLVKLLIGPFDAAGLANAQSRLQAAGIESFPR